MTKKIKTVYDNNQNASDPSVEGYSPYDEGTGTATARSDTQLASVIADRLGLTGNIPDPTRVSLTLPENTLTPVIDPITGRKRYWAITVNYTTAPTK